MVEPTKSINDNLDIALGWHFVWQLMKMVNLSYGTMVVGGGGGQVSITLQ